MRRETVLRFPEGDKVTFVMKPTFFTNRLVHDLSFIRLNSHLDKKSMKYKKFSN
jgi:hypothetical protein